MLIGVPAPAAFASVAFGDVVLAAVLVAELGVRHENDHVQRVEMRGRAPVCRGTTESSRPPAARRSCPKD
jgi:hypothetical protein